MRLPCPLLAAAALLLGCSSSDAPAPQPAPATPTRVLQGTLDADLLGSAEVRIEEYGVATRARVVLARSHRLLPEATPLEGQGWVESFAEADATLYAATFKAPPFAEGLCGDKPLALALSLRRSGPNARVAGGLAAYCTDGPPQGVPVRIVRLSGELGP